MVRKGQAGSTARQNQLQTESDPTAGKWFRHGPNNSVGLFGGLTDILVTDLVFEPGPANVNRAKDVALSTTLDHRSGLLNESAATNTLQWQITNSTTTSHSKTNSVKDSLTTKYSVKIGTATLGEVSKELSYGFEYSYSWADTEAVTLTDTKTFTSSIPLKVPQGKAYKLLVLADKKSLKVPYRALIRLKGVSEANFEHPLQGKTQHAADAGTVCSWIKKYGGAKRTHTKILVGVGLAQFGLIRGYHGVRSLWLKAVSQKSRPAMRNGSAERLRRGAERCGTLPQPVPRRRVCGTVFTIT